MDNERIYICADYQETPFLFPGVKKSNCADCEKPICVSASTTAFTSKLILICFDCHIKRLEKINQSEIILAVTPEAIAELREFERISRN